MRVYETTSQAYLATLQDIYENPDYRSSPRGQPIREKTDYSFRVLSPDSSPIITRDPERNIVIESYTRKEFELYNSCSNRVEDFAKASKFWEKLDNGDGTINSAYGYLIWANKSHGNPKYELHDGSNNGSSEDYKVFRTPWEWSKESLIADKDTRQAILRFSLPQHHWVGNKDFTCTLSGNFLIRDDKLHFSVVMRSCDLVLGLVYDFSWFCSLMDRMVEELKPYYPTLTKGHYTHFVHSLHIYEKNEEMVKKMIGAN